MHCIYIYIGPIYIYIYIGLYIYNVCVWLLLHLKVEKNTVSIIYVINKICVT